MQTSRNLTRLILALATMIAMCAMALAQTDSSVQVSDQKAGSYLVYPYYASGAAGSGTGDTRITISNVGPTAPFGNLTIGLQPQPAPAAPAPAFIGADPVARTVAVHLFFLDASCAQADTYVCLTPNASIAFKASDYDPFTTRGALHAIAVDPNGFPIAYNGLIGNAFVNYTNPAGDQYVGNYGAEAFFAVGFLNATIVNGLITTYYYSDGANPVTPGVTATLAFNDAPRRDSVLAPGAGIVGYDAAPNKFAVEVQSVNDAKDQTIVMAGLNGQITGLTGTAQVGVGTIYNGNERPFGSFTGFGGGCQSVNILTAQFPRVPTGMLGVIPAGQVGTIQWNVGAAVGLIMTPARVGQTANAWSGIRTLHKVSTANAATVTIPVFIPVC